MLYFVSLLHRRGYEGKEERLFRELQTVNVLILSKLLLFAIFSK